MPTVSYNTGINKFLFCYKKDSHIKAVLGTPPSSSSNNGPSWGSQNTILSSEPGTILCEADGTSSFLIAYRNNSSQKPSVIAASVSGTSISVGSSSELQDTGMSNYRALGIQYNAAQSAFVAFYVVSYPGGGTYLRPITVSGTSITLGTESTYSGGTSHFSNGSIVYDQYTQDTYLTFKNDNNSGRPGILKITFNSSTSISVSSAQQINTRSINTWAADEKTQWSAQNHSAAGPKYILYAYGSNGQEGYVQAVAVRTLVTNVTATNYIGISQAAASNGNTATIQTVGALNEGQSSLTPGSKYYVKNDGTLSTTADSPSVEAGMAVAATKLIVKG